MSPLCVVPRLRAVLRIRSSSERGSVMFFLTCVATQTIIHTEIIAVHTVVFK